MKKRLAATVLWLYAGWFAGAFFALAAGLPSALGPVFGVGAAALVLTDPLHVIWGRRAIIAASQSVATTRAASHPA